MGVTSPTSVFSECVVLCVTCRPLTCGPRLPRATPATLLGCGHLAHHLRGCPCRPPFWDVVTLLITCGAAPAAHPSGMRSPCSPPAGQKQSHTGLGTRSGPPRPGHTEGWPCPHSFPTQVSGQVSPLTSRTWCHSLPPRTHLGPVMSPGEEPTCQDYPQLYV